MGGSLVAESHGLRAVAQDVPVVRVKHDLQESRIEGVF